MSKRSIVDHPLIPQGEEEGELGRQEDIWVEHIFPNLYKDDKVTNMWMRFGLVSKKWLLMTRRVKEHRFKVSYNPSKHQYQMDILARRFWTGIVSLEIDVELEWERYLFIFSSMRTLVLRSTQISKNLIVGKLVNLTSLTVGFGVTVMGIENLKNLEHLSIMYMDERSSKFIKLSEHVNIKRLHLGKLRSYSHNYDDGSELHNLIPLKSTLEYLECSHLSIFRLICYTGTGKYNFIKPNHRDYECCYEGEWFEGKRHGNGVFHYGHNRYINSKWVNDYIQSGTIIYPDGVYYTGNLIDRRDKDKIEEKCGYMIRRSGDNPLYKDGKVFVP